MSDGVVYMEPSVVATPTCVLRWRRCCFGPPEYRMTDPELQQKWLVREGNTAREEWRPVPTDVER